ncbi:MAG: NAD-dependent epimerase/dehydratase family protein [Candidatus Omnitrophica bacterium]|nr:NAD-dependent epimerase/dehydratase family protein [Candidatus Omnitrophota bacterium]
MKKVVITGGAGFIGSNLLHYLRGKPYKLLVLDNLSTGTMSSIEECNIPVEVGDVRNSEFVAKHVTGCDIIVHLAAQTDVMNSIAQPLLDCDVNILGTLNVLKAAVDKHVKRVVFASSNAPVGEQTPPVDEKKVPCPLSPYGASKLAGEGYCHAFSAAYGLETIGLRFANAYGPRSGRKGSVIALFMKHILQGQQITVYGDGEQTRDFVYVNDICQAIERSMSCENMSSGIFQIGTGTETSINELIRMIFDVVGEERGVQYLDERKGEIRRNYCCIEKAREILRYDPAVAIRDGIRMTWDWFSNKYSKS